MANEKIGVPQEGLRRKGPSRVSFLCNTVMLMGKVKSQPVVMPNSRNGGVWFPLLIPSLDMRMGLMVVVNAYNFTAKYVMKYANAGDYVYVQGALFPGAKKTHGLRPTVVVANRVYTWWMFYRQATRAQTEFKSIDDIPIESLMPEYDPQEIDEGQAPFNGVEAYMTENQLDDAHDMWEGENEDDNKSDVDSGS